MKKVVSIIILSIIVYAITKFAYGFFAEKIVISKYKNSNFLKVKVSYSISQTEYHHLGTDISESITYKGNTIENGDKIIIGKKDNVFKITISEWDSIPDRSSKEIVFSKSDILRGNISKSTIIRVNENGGRRYPNAYAVFSVKITLGPAGLLSPFWIMVIFFLISFIIYAIKNKSSNKNNKMSTPQKKIDTQPNKKPQYLSKTAILCPRCGSEMVLRQGRYGYFYGCSRYPYCKGTRSKK